MITFIYFYALSFSIGSREDSQALPISIFLLLGIFGPRACPPGLGPIVNFFASIELLLNWKIRIKILDRKIFMVSTRVIVANRIDLKYDSCLINKSFVLLIETVKKQN